MSSEPDKKRIAELEQRVADLESRPANDGTTPLIVPKAVTLARVGLVLSFIIIVVGICALVSYAGHLKTADRPRIASEDAIFFSVPVVIYPILWSILGILVLSGLQRGTRWGRRLAVVRIWLALPLILVDMVMMFWAGLIRWPHLDLVMLSILLYLVTEVLFLVAGILVWRARARAARDAAAR